VPISDGKGHTEQWPSTAFDEWLHRESPESFASGAAIPKGWLAWLRAVYEREGPVPRRELEARAVEEVMASAHQALELVLDDVERVDSLRPTVTLYYETGIRVRCELGAYRTEESVDILDPDGPKVVEAIAAAVFDVIAEVIASPPLLCVEHSVGLHARTRSGRCVWWCSVGRHELAAIGELDRHA
jgi:uncharacterized protein YqcC (DUF446 family)